MKLESGKLKFEGSLQVKCSNIDWKGTSGSLRGVFLCDIIDSQ
jgi:hypothetical protein